MKKFSVIFLDLDDVLCDFRTAAIMLHGECPKTLEEKYPGRWDLVQIIQEERTERTGTKYSFTPTDFWKPINDSGSTFWANLRPTPWMTNLLTLVERYCDNIFVLSAPSQNASSHLGKAYWLKEHFGATYDKFFLTPYKHMLAKPGTWLIDDRKSNITDFRKAGGNGILFPSISNSLYHERMNPISYVYTQLETVRVSDDS